MTSSASKAAMAAAVPLMMRDIDPDRFAAFGALETAPNDGGRRVIPTRLVQAAAQGEVALSLITVEGIGEGHLARPKIERHPFSVQVFIPLGAAPLVPVVAPAELAHPRAQDLRAFRARSGQCVIYRECTWHLGMVCDGPPMIVAVFIRRLADGSDTETHILDSDLILKRSPHHG